jgi:hypothetical protein
MTVDPRILRFSLIPILLIVCVTVALWELRARDVPGARYPSRQTTVQERSKVPAGGSIRVPAKDRAAASA